MILNKEVRLEKGQEDKDRYRRYLRHIFLDFAPGRGEFKTTQNPARFGVEKSYLNQCLTAVIFNSDLPKFSPSPENYYLEKTVRIKGIVKEYQGRPEIILKDSSQIEAGDYHRNILFDANRKIK